jgi:hypothetical protein
MPAPPRPREAPESTQQPPLTREELRQLWRTYQCPTVRRLLLEIARLRKLALRARNVTATLMERERWEPGAKVSNVRIAERLLAELGAEAVVREDEGLRRPKE